MRTYNISYSNSKKEEESDCIHSQGNNGELQMKLEGANKITYTAIASQHTHTPQPWWFL